MQSALSELSLRPPPCLASAARDLVAAWTAEREHHSLHGYDAAHVALDDAVIEARKLFLSALHLNGVDAKLFERAI